MMRRDPYRNYRRTMRRHRRDGYPVLLFSPDEPLTFLAISALARWAYRHRSAFLPFIITAAAFIIAAMLHHHHPAASITITILTVIGTLVLGIPRQFVRPPITARILARTWEAFGISRPAERAYTTAVIATTGSWLAAAVAIGPAAKPLPAIAGIATIILGVPWWAHRRRRARVRALRTIQAWPVLAENMGLPGSRIASIVADEWGWTGRLVLRKGSTAAQAINQLPGIESGLGIKPGTARAMPDQARADRIILRIIEKDPHAEPIPWREPASNTITKPVDAGLYEDGSPVLVNILRRHVLIAGTTGAGKSVVENGFAAALAKCADAEPWGIDMKGGMELQPWAQALRHLATTPEQAVTLLALAVVTLDRRAAQLAVLGVRTWEPTPAEPAITIIIDEYAELPPDALAHADSIARRGRAVAVTLLLATQRPTQGAMGGNAVRSQIDVRICLRVRERRDTDLILGQGALNAGWDAHALTLPGTFLLSDPEHTTPMRARAYLITDAQAATHAARYAVMPGAGDAEPPPGGAGAAGPGVEPADSDAALWEALRRAGPAGITPKALALATGRGRTWIHERLREHASAGRVVQVHYGRWRIAGPPPWDADAA